MTQEDHTKRLRTEALWKLGRNVVNFQKLESTMKQLVVLSKVDCTPAELISHHEKQSAAIQKTPMGLVAEMLHDRVYSPDKDASTPADPSVARVSFRLKAEFDADTTRRRKEAMTALICERNRLIHHDLACTDFNDPESCQNLIGFLDEQNKRLSMEFENLVGLLRAAGDCADNLRVFVESGEYEKTLPQEWSAS